MEVQIKNKSIWITNKFLLKKLLGEEFLSLVKEKKKGIVIYVKKELEAKMVFSYNEGRYLAVEVTLNQKTDYR